jgi:protein-S-isoprenylcysteine O-methyltransferase Ste14
VSRLWLAVRSLFWAAAFPGMFAGYLPWRYFGVREARPDLGNPAALVGLALVAVGVALLSTCIFEFARSGLGTLSVIDPPRKLVVRGLYRYVRNPMYLSVVTIVLGELLLTGSPALLAYGAIGFGAINLFVLGYEEPNLRRRFGPAYEAYLREVGRWLPRLSRKPPG